jgi:rod shape-determining protein MreC
VNSRVGLLFGVLLFLSLVSVRFLPTAPLVFSSAVTPLWSVFYTVSTNLRNFVETLVNERDVRGENARLITRVAVLETENKRLSDEVRKLEEVTQIRATISPGVAVVAQVVGLQFDSLNALIRINKGLRDGVQEKMVVTTARGLVGEVMKVEARTALVRTLLDAEFRVGIKVANYPGTALARGVAGRFLRATNYRGGNAKVGDLVSSANVAGGAFPPIPVGRVTKRIELSGDTLGLTLEINPIVDISSLEQVYLLRLP